MLEILRAYPDRKELFADYRDLEEENLQQALFLAAALVDAMLSKPSSRTVHVQEIGLTVDGCASYR